MTLPLPILRRPQRLLAYAWASPTTALGLPFLLAACLSGGKARIVRGVIEIHGGLVTLFLRRATLLPGGASAMTLGHIILGRNQQSLDWARDHEHVHVRQAQRWGPFFIPAYLGASLYILLFRKNQSPYFDNPFEREAYAQHP